MSAKHDTYTLGNDVTSSVASRSRTGTVVLSVRVRIEEMAEIEATSRATGKSLSQLVRDAVSTYLHFQRTGAHVVTISDRSHTTSTGELGSVGKGARSQTISLSPELVTT